MAQLWTRFRCPTGTVVGDGAGASAVDGRLSDQRTLSKSWVTTGAADQTGESMCNGSNNICRLLSSHGTQRHVVAQAIRRERLRGDAAKRQRTPPVITMLPLASERLTEFEKRSRPRTHLSIL